MKRFILSFILPLATLAIISSCQKELDSPGNETIAPGVKLVINAGTPEVKSYMEYDSDNQKYLPRWHKNDALGVFIDSWEAGAAAVNGKLENSSDNGERAQFTGTISVENGSHMAYAFYPARAYYASEDSEIIDLEIPYIQFPSATSFDPKADILVSNPKVFEVTEGTVPQMDMQFTRIGAILKVTLVDNVTNIDLSTDKIKSVKLETFDVPLSGALRYNFGEMCIPNDSFTSLSKKSVKADYSVAPMSWSENAIYFVVSPGTWKAGSVLTLTVLTDHYEIVKTISNLPEIGLEGGKLRPLKIKLTDTDSIERVYFEDNFDWLYKYMDDLTHTLSGTTYKFGTAYDYHEMRQSMDPVANNLSSHAQPNVWNSFSDKVGNAFNTIGYKDMASENKVLYVQDGYFKIGANNKQTGIQLPPIAFGNEPVDAKMTFRWCRHMTTKNVIDEVPLIVRLLDKENSKTDSEVLTTNQENGQLGWTDASVTLNNVTDATRIEIRENYNDYSQSGQHRFHLDEIIITEALEEDVTFPVVWNFPEPGDNWEKGEDYDLQNPSGSYVYSDSPRHAGKLSIIRPGDDRITSSNPSYKKDTTPPWDGDVRLLQFGIYEDDEIRFEVDRVDNPAGIYTIKYIASSSNTGPRDFALEYSTNQGGTWTHFAGYSLRCAEGGVTNQKTEVKGSFNLTAFKGKLYIRARVSSTRKLDDTGEMNGKKHGGTTRIGVNASIEFQATE